MKKKMGDLELKNYILQNMECPYSVQTELLDKITYINQLGDTPPMYEVETTTDELGKIIIKVSINYGLILGVGNQKENTYTITIDSNSKSYGITSQEIHRSKEVGGPSSVVRTETNVEFKENAWNSKPGFIVTRDDRTTYAYKKDNSNVLDLVDKQVESKTFYDAYGVAYAKNSTNKLYPARENHTFTFGLPKPNFRTAFEIYESRTERTSLTSIATYTRKTDYRGWQIGEVEKSYAALSDDHDLGRMYVAITDLSEQEHQRMIINNSYLTPEQLDRILEKTPEPMRTGLITTYSSQRNKTR